MTLQNNLEQWMRENNAAAVAEATTSALRKRDVLSFAVISFAVLSDALSRLVFRTLFFALLAWFGAWAASYFSVRGNGFASLLLLSVPVIAAIFTARDYYVGFKYWMVPGYAPKP